MVVAIRLGSKLPLRHPPGSAQSHSLCRFSRSSFWCGWAHDFQNRLQSIGWRVWNNVVPALACSQIVGAELFFLLSMETALLRCHAPLLPAAPVRMPFDSSYGKKSNFLSDRWFERHKKCQSFLKILASMIGYNTYAPPCASVQ